MTISTLVLDVWAVIRDGRGLGPSMGWAGLDFLALVVGWPTGLRSMTLWWLGPTCVCNLFWYVVCST